MKTNKGFVALLPLGIIVLLIVGGSVYFYFNDKKAETPAVLNTETQRINQVQEKGNISKSVTLDSENIFSDQEKNGEYVGQITDLSYSKGNYFLTIDYMQFLDCETCPNNYTTLNTNPLLRTFQVANDVVIKMQTFSHLPSGDINWDEIVSLSEFKGIIDGVIIPPIYLESYNMMEGKISPYINSYKANKALGRGGTLFWITLKDGIITEIKEQYLP